MVKKEVKKLGTRTKRIKFSCEHWKQWVYSCEKTKPHYSSENYYSYYIKRHFLGKLTIKKVTVYLD